MPKYNDCLTGEIKCAERINMWQTNSWHVLSMLWNPLK